MRLASYQVTIAAPAEVVWAHLTTAEGLVRWVGPEATADPTPGRGPALDPPQRRHRRRPVRGAGPPPAGRLHLRLGGRPPRRRAGSTTVEIDLVEEDGVTTLRLVHHGLPPETVPDHQQGWAYFLDILRDTLSTG